MDNHRNKNSRTNNNNIVITNIIISLIVGLLQMIQAIFNAITFVIPTQIPYYFALFFSYARIGDGIFPMSDILLALFTIVTVWILTYIIKLVLWAARVIPFIGRLGNLPQHTMSTTTSETNTINGIKTTNSETTTQKKRWMKL